MNSLVNKRVLLGVTGGIAAYKSADLVRRLQDLGADVRVVMTPAAQAFITPLTMQALSGNPVHTELLDPEAEAGMGHIELARWADLVLVAPATADFLARLANGEGNDLLTTLCLATPAKICVAPAMNQGMWQSPATQNNLSLLSDRNIVNLGTAEGSQACGDIGPGRMIEPAVLAQMAAQQFESGVLAGRSVVITAGPTREALDPVRYISNHSSGKMGYALAEAAAEAGAKVTLISGPTALPAPEHCQLIQVESAQEMHDASIAQLDHCDLFIASAAVADYRAAQIAEQKIKKTKNDAMVIELVKNPDIVTAVANHEKRPFTIGFAAETQAVVHYARDKLVRKNLDGVVANDVSQSSIGFNSDDNEVTVVWPDSEHVIEKCSKAQLARLLIHKIALRMVAATVD